MFWQHPVTLIKSSQYRCLDSFTPFSLHSLYPIGSVSLEKSNTIIMYKISTELSIHTGERPASLATQIRYSGQLDSVSCLCLSFTSQDLLVQYHPAGRQTIDIYLIVILSYQRDLDIYQHFNTHNNCVVQRNRLYTKNYQTHFFKSHWF